MPRPEPTPTTGADASTATGNNAAQRHLLNRFLGQLHHFLQSRQHFDEQRAFAPLPQVPV